MPANLVGSLIRFGPWVVVGLLSIWIFIQGLENDSLQGELERSQQQTASLQTGLNVAKDFNQSLNQTVDDLKTVISNERIALDDIERHRKQVNAQVDAVVSDLKGLLNEDKQVDDSCTRRLPQPVIDRLWQYYRASGDHQNSG